MLKVENFIYFIISHTVFCIFTLQCIKLNHNSKAKVVKPKAAAPKATAAAKKPAAPKAKKYQQPRKQQNKYITSNKRTIC